MEKVVFFVLITFAVAAPTKKIPSPIIERLSTKNTLVDSKTMSDGITNVQLGNLARTNDKVELKLNRISKTIKMANDVQSEANEKISTHGGTVKSLQNSQSKMKEKFSGRGNSETISMLAKSKTNEKVISKNKSQTWQKAASGTQQKTTVADKSKILKNSGTTSAAMNEKTTSSTGSIIKTSQDSTSHAKKNVKNIYNKKGSLSKIDQSSRTQSIQQVAGKGKVKALQNEKSAAALKVNLFSKKAGDKISVPQNSVSKANQKVAVKSGSIKSLQKTGSSEKGSITHRRTSNTVDLSTREKSNSMTIDKVLGSGKITGSKTASSKTSDNKIVTIAGQTIQKKGGSESQINNEVHGKGKIAKTSQKSSSKSKDDSKYKFNVKKSVS